MWVFREALPYNDTGKLLRRQTRLNHMLEKKTPARKRRLGREVEVTAADRRGVRRMLGL